MGRLQRHGRPEAQAGRRRTGHLEDPGSGAWRAEFMSVVALTVSLALGALAISAQSASANPTVYLPSFFLNNISAYSAAADGSLSLVPGSPFATGIAPLAVAITPDSQYLYLGNFESGSVSAYSVASDGSLSPVAGSPFHTGTWPWGAAVSPDGGYLFVSNSGSDTISSFSIASDGSLSPVAGSPFPTASGAQSADVAVTPDGKHLYVPSGGKHSVVAFSIASDGSLSPVPGSPFETGSTPHEASVTPDGKYLYVSNVSSGTISAFSIASDGSLSPVSSSPVDTEGAPQDLAVTPDGEHLYVTHVGANEEVVWGYSIASNGSLSPVPGAPFDTGGFRSGGVGVSPDGRHLYVTSRSVGGPRIISAFSIAANGSLSLLPGFPLATEEGGWGAVTPDQGPVAAFSATPTPAGDPSSFDPSASSDPDGSVATYEWDFGDGQSLITSTAIAAHTYTAPGEYTVTLTVTDNEACSTTQIFTGQTASCNGSALAEVSHDVTVPPGVPLDVSLTGSGSGSVVSSPAGIACPGACSYYYVSGTEVTLSASSAPGSTFTGWSGGGCSSTEGACEVSVSEAEAVEAEFTIDTHTLEVGMDGAGAGDVNSSPAGIDECGAAMGNCKAVFDYGTVVSLAANPATGSTFTGWEGGGCSGTGACQVTLKADTEVTADFEKVPPPPPHPPPAHTLTVNLAGGGKGGVEDGTRSISCPPACSRSYAAGTPVILAAKPAPRTRFAGWSGGGCAGVGACQLTLDADTTLTATFQKSRRHAARLRIWNVRERVIRSGCSTGLAFVASLLDLHCAELRLAVGGTIAKGARGAVRIEVYLHGRRATGTERARIVDGRWRVRVPLVGADVHARLYITARFGGSPGVRGGYAKRRVDLKQ